MSDSLAHPLPGSRSLELPSWKNVASHLAAILLAITFATAGIWKMSDPFGWSMMVEQLRIPFQLSLALTLCLAVTETLGAVLILIPRFRRWGALLIGLLLVVFMIYIAANYSSLVGKECSCFPWVKRTVGPGFFIGDIVMLALAVVAYYWSRPSYGVRNGVLIVAALAVCTGLAFGVNKAHQTGTMAPETALVEGQPYSLQHGRVLLFFYDPECSHCDMAAKKMSKLTWKDVRVIALPTRQKQFAAAFLHDTGLRAKTSSEAESLKKVFPFGDPPYAVALENGREKAPVPHFDDNEPAETLRKLNFVE